MHRPAGIVPKRRKPKSVWVSGRRENGKGQCGQLIESIDYIGRACGRVNNCSRDWIALATAGCVQARTRPETDSIVTALANTVARAQIQLVES